VPHPRLLGGGVRDERVEVLSCRTGVVQRQQLLGDGQQISAGGGLGRWSVAEW